MIRTLKNLKTNLKTILIVLETYIVDIKYHLKYSLNYIEEKNYEKDSLRCSIMLLNHQLEKAQTYREQKNDYGKDKLIRLTDLLDKYIAQYGFDDIAYTSLGVMECHFSNPYAWKNEEIHRKFINILPDKCKNTIFCGGVFHYDPRQVRKFNKSDFYNFLNSRRSCRVFSDERISMVAIKEAISCAMTAPSACNRQTTRAHIYEDKSLIQEIVIAQKSDVQWCSNADKLLIITCNRYYYRDYLERNQGMFDAGLFSMVLNLALHNMGIGSCFKMAQKSISIENSTKLIANIPEHEDIVVLLIIGKYPDAPFIAAKSSRIDIENLLTIH